MEVELINNESSGGVLDLTNDAGAATDENTETQEQEKDVLQEDGGVVKDEDVDGDKPEGAEGSGSSDDDSNTDDSNPDEDSDDSDLEYYFGDTQVQVEVPDEIETAFKDAGIESRDVISQLYKKDGDFSLDEETKAKLDDKFGKTLVDGYLKMYKGLNEQAINKFNTDTESAKAQAEKEGKAFVELAGGEEGLSSIEAYVLDNLEDHQIEAYNSIMGEGSHSAQMLVISQLKSTMEAIDKAENGDRKLNLVGDSSTSSSNSSPLDKGFLTSEEYQDIINVPTSEYWEDRAYQTKVDKARLEGQKRGK